MKDLRQTEWDTWTEVVRILLDQKVITVEDTANPFLNQDTPGRKLFHAIKVWGESLADLRVSISRGEKS